VAGFSAGFDGFKTESSIMANNKTTAKANKTTAKVSTNKIAVAAVSPDQSEVISNLTALVKQLLTEITELKAAQADAKVPAKPANKTNNKTVNVVPPANGFILLAENETVSEVVTISAIGSPFWGKGFNGRSVMKVAVNCVTASGNTIVVFLLLNRDAVGNTIGSGLVGGANYVMTGVASGKTSEFNGNKANIVNKAKFSPVS
jgi:hypothetical protein